MPGSLLVSSSAVGGDALFEANGTLLLTRGEIRALMPFEVCRGCRASLSSVCRRKNSQAGIDARGLGGWRVSHQGRRTRTRQAILCVEGQRRFFSQHRAIRHAQYPRRHSSCDWENGYPLAIMDSTEITMKRTGGAAAVAAKYLARPECAIVTICGCGTPGRVELKRH
jgi:hypothetical protein